MPNGRRFLEWHRPITGDSFASLPKGIILSRTYNLIKSEVMSTESDMVTWSKYFSARDGNYVGLISEPDFDYLSMREREALDKGFDEITELLRKHGRKDIAEVCIIFGPNGKDPKKTCGKGSMPLELNEILQC